jgi:hypothetical protein
MGGKWVHSGSLRSVGQKKRRGGKGSAVGSQI